MRTPAHQGGGSFEPSPTEHDLAKQVARLRASLGDAVYAVSQLLEAQDRSGGIVDGDLADAISFARAEHARLKSELTSGQRAGGAQ